MNFPFFFFLLLMTKPNLYSEDENFIMTVKLHMYKKTGKNCEMFNMNCNFD